MTDPTTIPRHDFENDYADLLLEHRALMRAYAGLQADTESLRLTLSTALDLLHKQRRTETVLRLYCKRLRDDVPAGRRAA